MFYELMRRCVKYFRFGVVRVEQRCPRGHALSLPKSTTQLARDIRTAFNGEKYGTEVSDHYILGDCLTQVSGGEVT